MFSNYSTYVARDTFLLYLFCYIILVSNGAQYIHFFCIYFFLCFDMIDIFIYFIYFFFAIGELLDNMCSWNILAMWSGDWSFWQDICLCENLTVASVKATVWLFCIYNKSSYNVFKNVFFSLQKWKKWRFTSTEYWWLYSPSLSADNQLGHLHRFMYKKTITAKHWTQ